MKRTLMAVLVGAAALSAVVPAMAQPYGPPPPQGGYDRDHMGPPPPPGGPGYDRDHMGGGYGVGRDFWRGAPATPWERVQWLQDRINRGRQDGSLNPREAGRAQMQLDKVRYYAQGARRRYGDLRPEDREYIQRQLEYVSRLIRWERRDYR